MPQAVFSQYLHSIYTKNLLKVEIYGLPANSRVMAESIIAWDYRQVDYDILFHKQVHLIQ